MSNYSVFALEEENSADLITYRSVLLPGMYPLLPLCVPSRDGAMY